jgi:hypothetical protein
MKSSPFFPRRHQHHLQAKVHSYQGSKTFTLDSTGKPKFENGSSLELPFDFDLADKKILDMKFHAAARFFPAEDWFTFKMTGPGAVPVEQVSFARRAKIDRVARPRSAANCGISFMVSRVSSAEPDSLLWFLICRLRSLTVFYGFSCVVCGA